MNLKDKLIKLRKSKGLTQQELAKKINYSDKVISKWENGHSIPDMQAIKMIADFYNISVDEMINDCFIEKKTFSKLPAILFHIILLFIPIIILTSVLGYFNPKAIISIVPTWDAILPIVLGFLLVVLNIIDMVFTYCNLSRKIIAICIFAVICILFVLSIITIGTYGRFSILTKPFIYLVITAAICTAYGFLFNKKF